MRSTVMEGPLAQWEPGLTQELKRLGYTKRTASVQMALARRLSQYLQKREMCADELSTEVVGNFLDTVRTEGGAWGCRPVSLPWLVDYFMKIGVISPSTQPVPRSPEELLVERYRSYILAERGLVPSTAKMYIQVAVLPFLKEHGASNISDVSASDVSRFVTRQCRQMSTRSTERLVVGLRSFLDFVHLEGLVTSRLSAAVPSPARWSQASLPRGLTAEQVAALQATCDRRRAVGRRNYAILVMFSRLGLRTCEVAALRLDDIDWRLAEIVVRGKGGTEERLPLPEDVGDAIAGYLRRGRPRRPEREVFLRAIAPRRGLQPQGVAEVVRNAAERAGIGRVGPHRLRHTAATEMLRAGASLVEIAQVLRHRSVATTAIYAKVDHLALAELAQPWPGSER